MEENEYGVEYLAVFRSQRSTCLFYFIHCLNDGVEGRVRSNRIFCCRHIIAYRGWYEDLRDPQDSVGVLVPLHLHHALLGVI